MDVCSSISAFGRLGSEEHAASQHGYPRDLKGMARLAHLKLDKLLSEVHRLSKNNLPKNAENMRNIANMFDKS